jgi:putative ABC transport system substrate-binding protein
MRRSAFVSQLFAAGWAAMLSWPFAAGAQDSKPVLGFINTTSPAGYPEVIAAFHKGLAEAGYVDGRNVTIEYRWAEGHVDRLPGLAADLVRRKVSVIVATGGDTAAMAAKAATTTIPIVFNSASDPVRLGLVKSLSRPGGNLTGVSRVTTELLPKRLELLVQTAPQAKNVAFLVNPSNRTIEPRIRDVQNAARSLGRTIHLIKANTPPDIDAAFAGLAAANAGALLIVNDSYFNARAAQLGALSLRYRTPAIYQGRNFVNAGGLMSYGASLATAYRIMGGYAGRILKGEKPAELAVQQQAKVDFVINLKTARAIGVTIPLPLQGLADELID